MPRNRKIMIGAIMLLTAGLLLWQWYLRNGANGKTVEVEIKGEKFSLEVAKSGLEREKGLSGRDSLCPRCGMVFVFSGEGVLPFWMKDTKIPLDMIWVNKNGEVVEIKEVQTEIGVPLTQLTTYRNTKVASRVIELNYGEAKKIGLEVGDKINLPEPL